MQTVTRVLGERSAEAASTVILDFIRQLTRLRKTVFVTGLFLAAGLTLSAHPQNAESGIGGTLILIAAITSTVIWLRKPTQLPLFPVFAASYAGAYALPLLYGHPVVMAFSPDAQLRGALTVTGFLFLGTFFWYLVWKQPPSHVHSYLLLRGRRADVFFLCALLLGVIVTAGSAGEWFDFAPGIFSIMRAVSAALNALGCFVLSYRSGDGTLLPGKRISFQVVFLALLLANLISLLLINAISLVVVAGLGYFLGSRRIPWRSGLLVLCFAILLQAGKSDMRLLYWNESEEATVQPWDYLDFLDQWLSTSLSDLASGQTRTGNESQSLIERASLMQILLHVQAMTPEEVPFLNGETYALIPSLLIPRFFNAEKIASHEGTYLLNIHYGFQTREDTTKTTIGFGLLNEAFANFGFFGVAGLGVILGLYYGMIARWSEGTPVLSFRSLFAILVASYAFQTEFAAGVYVAAIFQSTVALLLVATLFMRTRAVPAHPRENARIS